MSDLYDYFYNTLGSHCKAEEAMRRWNKSKLEEEVIGDKT
jgi:hypothetical protein